MLDMAVRACFDTSGTIKTEMTMRVIMWHMAKEGQEGEAPQGGYTRRSGVEDREFPAGGRL